LTISRKARALGGLAIGALLTASLAAVAPANASPAAGTGGVSGLAQLSPDVAATVQGTDQAAYERALADYWTPARMRAAKPDSELPSVKAAQAALTAPTTGTRSRPDGPAARVDAAAPVREPRVTTPVSGTDAGTEAYYPNYPVGHPVARTYGKVFFSQNGGNYVCSATIVNTVGKSTVWTAAHCNTAGGTWSYNWTFVPNYYNGVAPYGYWYAYQLWSTTAFFNNNNDFANDVGAAIMNRQNGWRIAEYFGAQGIAWNYPASYFAYAFGYPQGAPFDGSVLVGEANQAYDGGGGVIYMINYMTGGSSGGAWLYAFDGNWGYINGHNDFKYTSLPQYMYSPYYGNQVADLYNTVNNLTT
jgi:hypothetical protein